MTILSNDSEMSYHIKSEFMDGQNKFITCFYDTILENIDDDNNIFISNSYSSTKVFEKLVKKYPNSKYFAYTHIGDMFFPDKADSYDFNNDINIQFLNTMKSNDFIKILTQTECMNNALSRIINRDDILTIPEPLYMDNVYDIGLKDNSILIVCSNYRRKRFDVMLKYIGMIGKPVKILCHNKEGYYDIPKLMSDNGIKRYSVMENLSNSEISFHILSSVMMLHFSDIEVCPYSILEASSFIPVLINNNSEWSKSFENICEMVDYNNEDSVVEAIESIYNGEIGVKFILDDYVGLFEKKWRGVLDVM